MNKSNHLQELTEKSLGHKLSEVMSRDERAYEYSDTRDASDATHDPNTLEEDKFQGQSPM